MAHKHDGYREVGMPTHDDTRTREYECGCSVHCFVADSAPHLHMCNLHIGAERLARMLETLDEHAQRYGGVPASADKLWDSVHQILNETLGGKIGFSVQFGVK